MRSLSRPLILLALLLALPTRAADQITIVKDLPYKSGDQLTDYERTRCKLDLYLPARDAKNFPTVVWFYGGSLEAGDKSGRGTVRIATALANNGIACAAVNYRLHPKATYPAYLDDAAASVAWTIAHVAEHGGDPKRVFVAGHSAGAFLTAAIGYDPKFLKPYHVSTDQIAGLIPVSPQLFTHFTIRKERGVPNPQTTPVIDDDAPAYHARPDAPPTLILLGDNDWPTRLEECQYFIKLLTVLKHPDAHLQVIADRTHGSIADKIPDKDDPAMKAILSFIMNHPTTPSRPTP